MFGVCGWSRARGARFVCAGALVVVSGAFSACARPAPASQETAGPDAAQLFDRACTRCHASDGSGGLPMVPNGPRPIDLRDAAWQASRSDEEITAAIRDGRGAMPPFSDVLTPSEVTALAGYVRRMGKPAAD